MCFVSFEDVLEGVELNGYLVHVVGGYMRTAVWQTGMEMIVCIDILSMHV